MSMLEQWGPNAVIVIAIFLGIQWLISSLQRFVKALLNGQERARHEEIVHGLERVADKLEGSAQIDKSTMEICERNLKISEQILEAVRGGASCVNYQGPERRGPRTSYESGGD